MLKIFEVFSKEYKKETERFEFFKRNLDVFKLETTSVSIDDKIKKLIDENFVSSFKIDIK